MENEQPKNSKILPIAVLVVLGVLALFVMQRKENPAITDFASCQFNGGTMVDGEPVKCVAPDGREFQEAEHTEPEVVVTTPEFGATVSSPLKVTGRAKGFWFFEANIPVTLKDQNGKILAQQGFQAKGEWMTEDYVEFEGELTFDDPETEYGVLIINKDNPSGLPELDASFAVPVRFK